MPESVQLSNSQERSRASDSDDRAPDLRSAFDHRAREVIFSDSRFDLAAAIREVTEGMIHTRDGEAVVAAAALVRHAAVLISGSRPGESTGVAEDTTARRSIDFLEFSPFVGQLNPLAPPIRLSFGDDEVFGHCTYGPAYEGPPGSVHGGFIAAGFDEVIGFAHAHAGTLGLTAKLEVSYRSTTPLGREVCFVGRVDRVDGRKIRCSATLSDGDRLCAEATGLVISINPETFQRMVDERRS